MDTEKLLKLLKENKVIFLVIGASAFPVYGYARATLDIDLFIKPDLENIKRTIKALEKFGYDLRLKFNCRGEDINLVCNSVHGLNNNEIITWLQPVEIQGDISLFLDKTQSLTFIKDFVAIFIKKHYLNLGYSLGLSLYSGHLIIGEGEPYGLAARLEIGDSNWRRCFFRNIF